MASAATLNLNIPILTQNNGITSRHGGSAPRTPGTAGTASSSFAACTRSTGGAAALASVTTLSAPDLNRIIIHHHVGSRTGRRDVDLPTGAAFATFAARPTIFDGCIAGATGAALTSLSAIGSYSCRYRVTADGNDTICGVNGYCSAFAARAPSTAGATRRSSRRSFGSFAPVGRNSPI